MVEEKQIWLTQEFVNSILKNDIIRKDFRIVDFKLENAIKNGENYSSKLHRLNVNYCVQNDAHFKSYIIKEVLDPNTDAGKNLAILNVFNKEVTMYSQTLVEIQTLLESAGIPICFGPRMLYWCNEPVQLLVLEDLLPMGFSTPDRTMGLDKTHCELALEKLALLHAASMFLNKKNPDFRSIYNKGCFHANMPEMMIQYFINAVTQAIDVMQVLPNCHKYVEQYQKYCENLVPRGIQMLQQIPNHVEDFNVLCHGDFWLNNIMFKYDETGKPIDVFFVDLQMSTFTNPGIDLNYFFFTSPTTETRRNYREELLQVYVKKVVEVLQNLKYDGMIPSYEDLSRKLFEARDIAIITPCIVLPIVKLNKKFSEEITPDSLMTSKENNMGSGLYDNPSYHEALSDAMSYLNQIGFISETNV